MTNYDDMNYQRIRVRNETYKLLLQIIKAQPVGEEESQVQLLGRLIQAEWERMRKEKEGDK
jgi:hypothetical protein